jgi:hypothetical protein
MGITRRNFLTDIAGGMAAGLGLCRPSMSLTGAASEFSLDCALLDLGDCCGLRESVAGYRAALTGMGVQFDTSVAVLGACPDAGRERRVRMGAWPALGARTWIVPATVELAPLVATRLAQGLFAGRCVLLESAAGFADPHRFHAQRAVLQEQFGVWVEAPVHLWDEGMRPGHVPYVDYVWPLATKVRDFSRVVPVARQETGIIGWVNRLPVALRRRVGRGTLVFLGSPMGPALRAGDAEAHRWLGKLLACSGALCLP